MCIVTPVCVRIGVVLHIPVARPDCIYLALSPSCVCAEPVSLAAKLSSTPRGFRKVLTAMT